MAWITTTDTQRSRGLRRMLARGIERLHSGFLPGIFRILLVDLNVLLPTGWLYNHLHLRDDPSLSTLQREMIATVVNGKIDGAP